MPKAEFNESTYAQNVTAEIVDWLRNERTLSGKPILPSLSDEADLGYDLSIPAKWGMLYIQYKLSEYMTRSHAREYRYIGADYYRFTVKTDRTLNGNIQHNALCALEKMARGSNGLVFYMAPCFITDADFDQFFREGTVLDNSVYARPLHLGMVKEGALHRYAYTGLHDVRPFSEPLPEGHGAVRELLGDLGGRVSEAPRTALGDYLEQQIELLEAIQNQPIGRELPLLTRLYSNSASLGLQPVLVRSNDGEDQNGSSPL